MVNGPVSNNIGFIDKLPILILGIPGNRVPLKRKILRKSHTLSL